MTRLRPPLAPCSPLVVIAEGMIYTLSYPPPSPSRGSDEDVIVPKPAETCLEMFDIPFIFSFVKIILAQADNTVTLMRTIAFLYAHFEMCVSSSPRTMRTR